jgi:hypothetical protein
MWEMVLLASLSGAAAPVPAVDATKPPLVSPKRLIEMYQTNEAFADERYSDKVIHVRGKVVRIRSLRGKSAGAPDPLLYRLELDTEGAGSNKDDRLILELIFDDKQRKVLASLNPGDIVTVEGRCGRRCVWDGKANEGNGGKDFSSVQINPIILVPKKEGAARKP